MRLFFFLLTLLICNSGTSQLNRIRLSPLQKVEQNVGITDMTIVYSRPAMRDRQIFGALIPYGELWRTGANRNTKITFSKDVTIGDQRLSAGTYALFTRPNLKSWEAVFYTETDNWDVPEEIDSSKIAATILITPQPLTRRYESLTLTIDNIMESTAHLGIAWENTYVAIPIDFLTREHMDALIEKQLDRDKSDYHIAAAYYEERNIELDKAKVLMEKAISLTEIPEVWDYRVYAIILDKLGLRNEAIEAAKTSLRVAIETDHESGIRENTADLKKWGAL